MIHVEATRRFLGQRHRELGKQIVVAKRELPSLLGSTVEITELHVQDGCMHAVEPTVDAENVGMVLHPAAVPAEDVNSCSHWRRRVTTVPPSP